MKNSITLSKTDYQNLLNRVKTLEHIVRDLVGQLKDKLDLEPPYGSDAWWEWSSKKGEENIRAGRSTRITSKKELKTFFESL